MDSNKWYTTFRTEYFQTHRPWIMNSITFLFYLKCVFSLAFCHIFLWFFSVFALISWKYRTFMMWITWHCSEKIFVCMYKLDSTQARCQRWLHKFDYVSLWCLVESDFFKKMDPMQIELSGREDSSNSPSIYQLVTSSVHFRIRAVSSRK